MTGCCIYRLGAGQVEFIEQLIIGMAEVGHALGAEAGMHLGRVIQPGQLIGHTLGIPRQTGHMAFACE